MAPNKIFVSGGAGYIGSICVEEMLNRGFEIAVYDNLTEGHRTAVDPRASFFEGDLADLASVRRAFETSQPEAVMHFAANALVGESMQNPSKYFRNNVSSGLNLLDIAVEYGVQKFVFSSTCATFGIPKTTPIDESIPQWPINPYGESKLMFENIL
jgi:UDP-glucose 4-epimerase